MNQDVIEKLAEIEYLFRQEVIFSQEELNQIQAICEEILNHASQ